MKTRIITGGAFAVLFILFAVVHAYDFAFFESELYEKAEREANLAHMYPAKSLPNQAWVCDMAGIGRVVNSSEEPERNLNNGFADIVVDSYWRGNPGTNSFRITMNYLHQPPVTNTPIVFFLTKYSSLAIPGSLPPFTSIQAPRVNMDIFRANNAQDGIWLYRGKSSWFHVDEKNAGLVAFASNLVFAVDSNNTNEFYKTMRDACSDYEWYPPNQDDWRVYFDAIGGLIWVDFYFTTNYIFQTICKDRDFPETEWLLPMKGNLNGTYGTRLTFRDETLIKVK